MSCSGRTAFRVVLALAIAVGCAVPPPSRVDPTAVGAARYPGAAAILSGFDDANPDADWRTGDRVLLGLWTQSGAEVRAKLIEIEVLGASALNGKRPEGFTLTESIEMSAEVGDTHLKWSSPILRTAVRVYEPDGRLLQETEAKLPESVLRTGLHATCELYSALVARAHPDGSPPTLSPEEMLLFAKGVAMIPTLLGILQDDEVLRPLLVQVVGPPPLLTILRGINVDALCDLELSHTVDEASVPCARGPFHRMPLHVAVNDAPTLELEMEVAAAEPPLRLTGGVLSIHGVSCRGADRTMTLELLAARCGPAGAEIRW